MRRAHDCGSQLKDRVFIEGCRESLFGQFHTIALYSWKLDFQSSTFWQDCLYLNGFTRGLRRRNHRLCCKVEGDTEHIGILDTEEVLFIEFIGLTAQCTTYHLLTKQLSTECAHTQYMGDGIGIPAFGQHGDRDHTADRFPKCSRLTNGIHHLSK